MTMTFKRCPVCNRPVSGNRQYCDDPTCQRGASALRKAAQRRRDAAPVPELDSIDSEAPTGFLAPWGITYATPDAAMEAAYDAAFFCPGDYPAEASEWFGMWALARYPYGNDLKAWEPWVKSLGYKEIDH